MRYYVCVWKKSGNWAVSNSSEVNEDGYTDINTAYRARSRAAELNTKVKNNRYIVVQEGQVLVELPAPR